MGDLTATTPSGDKLFCMKIDVDTPKQLKGPPGVDCSRAACPDHCECGLHKCGGDLNLCLANPVDCARGLDCALSCACGDSACEFSCFQHYPSDISVEMVSCLRNKCASAIVTGVDCSQAACPDQCQCGLDKC